MIPATEEQRGGDCQRHTKKESVGETQAGTRLGNHSHQEPRHARSQRHQEPEDEEDPGDRDRPAPIRGILHATMMVAATPIIQTANALKPPATLSPPCDV